MHLERLLPSKALIEVAQIRYLLRARIASVRLAGGTYRLKAAGVQVTPAGIRVDERLRTTASRCSPRSTARRPYHRCGRRRAHPRVRGRHAGRAFAGQLAQAIHADPTMSLGVRQAVAQLFAAGRATAGEMREELASEM